MMDNFEPIRDRTRGLPNATASLVLGVLSISMCYCWGTVGLVLAIIGLVMANKAVNTYRENPDVYAEDSYSNANAGKVCSIIGIVLSAIILSTTIFSWSSYYAMWKSLMSYPGFL